MQLIFKHIIPQYLFQGVFPLQFSNKKGSSFELPFLYSYINYFNVTLAPTSSNLALIDSASSLATPSLSTFGAPSTASLASFKPRPVISRTTLITLIFSAPASVNSTSKSVFLLLLHLLDLLQP